MRRLNLRLPWELVETGRLRLVIDRVHPLEEVLDAARYVETHHETGDSVLRVGASRESGA